MIIKSPVALGIPFDPTGSSLTSTDVESAIKEITASVASGLVNYNLTSSTAFTTSSTTDVVITGFTVTPVSGTYACFYNADSFYTTTPRVHWWSFYRAGVKVTESERSQITSRSNQDMVDSTISVLSFNGSQSLDVRVRRDPSGGALTVNDRTLVLLRLGA